jgi:poly(A) polymerase
MIRAAKRIVGKLRLNGHEAVFAGGWVRDFLLNRKPKDIDIATSALPEEVLRLFPRSKPIGAKFGVIRVLMYGRAYEVATFRKDSAYLDGRHPSAVAFCRAKEDALRRDFTINGLFYDPFADRLIDYVHGRRDLRNRQIRTIGHPHLRFAEDKLRMLRAIRLSCSLDFKIAPKTWVAIREQAPDILEISRERIRDELIRIFTGPRPGSGLDLLDQSGLLAAILPEVSAMRGVPQSPESLRGIDVYAHTRTALEMLRKPSAVLAFGTLLHDAGKPLTSSATQVKRFDGHARIGSKISSDLCRRLRMSNEEINRIADLVRTHMDFTNPCEMKKSALMRLLSKPDIADHLELYRVNCLSNRKGLQGYRNYLQMLEEYRNKPEAPPLIKGDDLIKMGYSPGPIYSRILRTVSDLQIEGALRTRKDAIQFIRKTFPVSGRTRS